MMSSAAATVPSPMSVRRVSLGHALSVIGWPTTEGPDRVFQGGWMEGHEALWLCYRPPAPVVNFLGGPRAPEPLFRHAAPVTLPADFRVGHLFVRCEGFGLGNAICLNNQAHCVSSQPASDYSQPGLCRGEAVFRVPAGVEECRMGDIVTPVVLDGATRDAGRATTVAPPFSVQPVLGSGGSPGGGRLHTLEIVCLPRISIAEYCHVLRQLQRLSRRSALSITAPQAGRFNDEGREAMALSTTRRIQ